jgi:hypothetical protein
LLSLLLQRSMGVLLEEVPYSTHHMMQLHTPPLSCFSFSAAAAAVAFCMSATLRSAAAAAALCLDMELLCPLWASLGECAANPKYMVGTPRKLGHCRASCGKCQQGGMSEDAHVPAAYSCQLQHLCLVVCLIRDHDHKPSCHLLLCNAARFCCKQLLALAPHCQNLGQQRNVFAAAAAAADNSWRKHPIAKKELAASASTLLNSLRQTTCTATKACLSGGGGSTIPASKNVVQQNAEVLPGAALAKMDGG